MTGHMTVGAPAGGRRCTSTVALLSAMLLLGTVLSGPAAGDERPGCGEEITEDTELTADIGPCPGHGLVVVADGVTLDLGGHTVTGDPDARQSPDKAGILLRRVSGATVRNGTVERFDAGVAVMGGGGNTVTGVTAQDNVNYRVVTGRDALPVPGGPVCVFGDGVAVFNSGGNRIEGNVLAGNGPLSGLSLVGDSDDNVVSSNQVVDNDVRNRSPLLTTTVCGTGPDQGPMSTGREVQNVGIRVEGPGAERNRVEGNEVRNSSLAGIALHGYVCDRAPNNGDNDIARNTVTETGRTTHGTDAHAHGIAVLQQGPAGTVCVAHSNTITDNTSSGNFADGIFLGGRGSHGNTVSRNVVDGNARDGLRLTGPQGELPGAVGNKLVGNRGQGNAGYDGADYNPDCDDNVWRNSRFGTVNQACVAGPGGGARA